MQAEIIRIEFGPLCFEVEQICFGAGPPLLFLHGIDGTEGAAHLLNMLSKDFTVYAPSHPGFGASTRPPEVNTIADLAYFYLDYIQRMNLTDITLVGSSFGSWLGCEILTRDASRFTHTILSGPLGLLQVESHRNALTDIFAIPTDTWPSIFCADSAKFRSPAHNMGPEELLRIARNREAYVLYGWSPYMANPKLANRLHRVKTPTLLVHGNEDKIVPAAYGQAFARAIPGARLETAENCGHLVHADGPRTLASMISSFAAKKNG